MFSLPVKKVVATSRYTHPELGPVRVRVVASARSLRARWDGSVLSVTIPKNCPADEYDRFIDSNVPVFLEMRPPLAFRLGQVIDGDPADFFIHTDSFASRTGGCRIELRDAAPDTTKCGRYHIILSPDLVERGVEDPYIQDFINKALIRAAEYATKRFIIPEAHRLAELVGHRPAGWTVKYKKRSLGTCDSKGIISLNPRIAFLPARLRNFVILHELAHLSEMNHSAAFHEVCNRYCGGREAELNTDLRRFPFPVR